MNNILIQNLKAYPQAIFNLELKAMVAMSNKQRAKSDLDFYLFGVDEAIAKNQELKNEIMRKARRLLCVNTHTQNAPQPNKTYL